MSKLTEKEIERYARHICLPEIGGMGQQKLKNAKIMMIGVGGLGSAAVSYLAAAGVGTIGLVDGDLVSLDNLQRQIIHHTTAIGAHKTTSAKDNIYRLNPHIKIREYPIFLDRDNIDDILNLYDLILDGTDQAGGRYLIADRVAQLQKPLVSAALGRFDGWVSVFMPYLDNNPGYRDWFPQPKEENPQEASFSCSQAGVIGALPGVIGSLQAMEAIKLICKIGEPLTRRLLLYDALNAHFEIIYYDKRAKLASTGT